MEVRFEIYYHADVISVDLVKLDKAIKERIKHAIEQKLITDPIHFGIPLRRSLRGYCKLRVGSYRIVFKILTAKKEVRILGIMHRAAVYDRIQKRKSLQ